MTDEPRDNESVYDRLARLESMLESMSRRLDSLERERPTRASLPPAPTPPSKVAPPAPRTPARIEKPAETETLDPPRRERPPINWERFVGARAFAAAGSLILVIAAALFLKLAYDEGWLGRVPVEVRCLLAVGFGGLLIALGEVIRTRINALASTGLSASGLAIIYATVFAATRLVELISVPSGFVLLALTAALGIALGAIGKRVFLASLSLIGAYLAPLTMATGEPSPVFFPAYLLALLVMGLTLSGWLGPPYQHLRRLAWWGTVVLTSLWAIDMASYPLSVVVFVLLVWLATHLELIASSRFFERLRPRQAARAKHTTAFVRSETGADVRASLSGYLGLDGSWLLSSFASTTWAFALTALAFREISPQSDVFAPLLLFGASLGLAFASSPNPPRVWGSEPSARLALSASLLAQSAALLLAIVALGLGGWTQLTAWFAIGIAAVAAARYLRFPALNAYGILLLLIGAVRVITLDLLTFFDERPEHVFTVLRLGFGDWSARCVTAAAAFAIGAHLQSDRPARTALLFAGAMFSCLAFATPGNPPLDISIAWGGLALGAIALHRYLAPRSGLDLIALLIAGASATVYWMSGELQTWRPSDAAPLAIPVFITGVSLSIVLLAIARSVRVHARPSDTSTRALALAGMGASGIMLFVLTSTEVHRSAGVLLPGDPAARDATLSIWWALYAIALLVLGTIRRAPALRYTGLALLALAGAKVVLVDLATVSPVWRIVSAAGVAVLMLVVAIAYARRAGAPVPSRPEPESTA
ncbi:MAG: DUF2339 domain-containing protein [Planctomycetota bacterium]